MPRRMREDVQGPLRREHPFQVRAPEGHATGAGCPSARPERRPPGARRYRCTVCLSATFDTQRGVEVHYARCHGPKAVEKTAVPEGLPARPRAIVEPVPPAPKPAPADSARTREIDPDRQAFLDRMRAARDELADAEQAAERELAQMRTVIVALDGLLDSY